MPAIRKSARKVATQNYVDAMSSAEESEARSHPPPKRQRTKNQSLTTVTVHADPKWKHTRGKRGLLQEVADFPLDVLYEVIVLFYAMDVQGVWLTLFFVLVDFLAPSSKGHSSSFEDYKGSTGNTYNSIS